jgi:hypothetical protein
MYGPQGQDGLGLCWIVLLMPLCIIFNPIPGPIDDAVATGVAGHYASRAEMATERANLVESIATVMTGRVMSQDTYPSFPK